MNPLGHTDAQVRATLERLRLDSVELDLGKDPEAGLIVFLRVASGWMMSVSAYGIFCSHEGDATVRRWGAYEQLPATKECKSLMTCADVIGQYLGSS